MANKTMVMPVDLVVAGNLRPNSFTPPAGCIPNAAIPPAAGIAYTKLQQKHQPVYSQAGTAAAETRVVHVVLGASGTLVSVAACLVTACTGDATVTVDLQKNGTTILTAPLELGSGVAAFDLATGTIDAEDLEADDVLTAVVTVDAGTGALGTGLAVVLEIAEDPA